MRCPTCNISYDQFRTGFTFADIVSMLWVDDPDSSRWRYKRRHTVLGKLHEIKKQAWLEHVEKCGTGEPLIVDPHLDDEPDQTLLQFDFSEY